MDLSAPDVVRIRRVIAARPADVFRALTEPDLLRQWLSPTGHAEVTAEPRIGGRLMVTMIGSDRQIDHTGEFRELIAGRRVVFTWSSPFTGEQPSLVTFELLAVPGGTELTLLHERLPREAVSSHSGGWSQILDRLEAVLSEDGHDG